MKHSFSQSAISQLERSFDRAEILDVGDVVGVEKGRLLMVDPREATITGTHKGWSYAGMILEAYKRGEIDESTLLTEFTSGNAGEAAADVANLLGLKSEIVMPAGITPEREARLSEKAGKLVLTPEKDWLLGSMNYGKEAEREEKERFLINQSANSDNVLSLMSVFRNVLMKLNVLPDFQIATVGTGGTIAGIGRSAFPSTRVVGVDPMRSASTKAFKEGRYADFQHGKHKYWGGGAGAASPLVQENIAVVDEVMAVSWEQAFDLAKWLGDKGLNVGLSTGGNVYAAMEILQKNPEAVVLSMIHDTSETYRSMGL